MRSQPTLPRLFAVLLSPLAFLAAFLLLDTAAKAIVGTRGPAYLPTEAGIAVAAVVWFILGAWLMLTLRRRRVSERVGPGAV
ncbi:MAG: hypothetical protein CYG59_02340 [Chloroflexi bacterium]|nr:MAG: hypothetical protein CYG59_02340 [Chloroflexota bacterium]